MPAGLVLAAALLAAPGSVESAARPALVSYEVTESTRTMTPAGERTRSLSGTLRVAAGRARWELTRTTFPRSSASVAIADGPVVTLLDTKERLAASATPDDFTALFQGRAATEGSASVAVRDVAVRLAHAGNGKAFQGRPTSRFTLEATWTLVHQAAGRVARVATRIKGTIETLDEPEARSLFDGLSRLLPARGTAAEALDAELAKLPGLPVSAALDVVSWSSVEPVGAPASTEPVPPPVETRQTIARKVANLSTRAGVAADDALFAVPDDFRARSLDRIVPEDLP